MFVSVWNGLVKWSTYLLDLGCQRLLRAACDLSDELVELALAKHAVAFTFELEWRRAWDNRLSHGSRRTVGRPAHSRTSLTHVHWRWRCDVEVAWNRHLGVVELLALSVAKVTLTLLHRSTCTLRVGVGAVRSANCSLVREWDWRRARGGRLWVR